MDSVFNCFNVSSSGLASQRQRLDVIASNIANINTTRTPEGGPYKRKDVAFSEILSDEFGRFGGVALEEVETGSEPRKVFDPSHPDAAADGYVSYPDIDLVSEMVDMIHATRAYEANIQVLTSAKSMITKSFELLK